VVVYPLSTPSRRPRPDPRALEAVAPFLKTNRLSDSEQAMLMGGACAKAYGWSTKKT
jgi:hypothetical protein